MITTRADQRANRTTVSAMGPSPILDSASGATTTALVLSRHDLLPLSRSAIHHVAPRAPPSQSRAWLFPLDRERTHTPCRARKVGQPPLLPRQCDRDADGRKAQSASAGWAAIIPYAKVSTSSQQLGGELCFCRHNTRGLSPCSLRALWCSLL